MNEDHYQDQIKYYQAKLGLLIGLTAALIIGEGLMLWQWYFKNGQQAVVKGEFELKREEFSRLWQKLEERTVAVELEEEIKYGEDIGKLEPFE